MELASLLGSVETDQGSVPLLPPDPDPCVDVS